MTPKEKATELYDMFYKVNYIDDYDYLTGHNSKECAKIAVDEIINAPSHIDIPEKYEEYIDFRSYFDYWQEVKQELEKL